MKDNKFNFKKQTLMNLKAEDKRLVYHDTKEIGLSLYVTTSGVKTFFIRKRIKSRDEKIILGRFSDLSIEQARKLALVKKGELSRGLNPNIEKRKVNIEIKLEELFTRFLKNYAKQHKKTWKYDEQQFNRYLSSWSNRKLSSNYRS